MYKFLQILKIIKDIYFYLVWMIILITILVGPMGVKIYYQRLYWCLVPYFIISSLYSFFKNNYNKPL